jgi:hypothetical protein
MKEEERGAQINGLGEGTRLLMTNALSVFSLGRPPSSGSIERNKDGGYLRR